MFKLYERAHSNNPVLIASFTFLADAMRALLDYGDYAREMDVEIKYVN